MFLKKKTERSTESYSEKIARLNQAIANADSVVIGAGAGLSTAAGLSYSGKRFSDNFAEYIERYQLSDMYSAAFYNYKTPEQFWGYFSRHIYFNRYNQQLNSVFDNLKKLILEKDYFVLTTNVDHIFQKSGFSKERLFYTQGDYGLFQCSVPCQNKTYDNEDIIMKMIEQTNDLKVPTALLPHCPLCGAPLTTNLRKDSKFVEDSGWHSAYSRYERYIKEHADKKVLYLELGVGYNTPSIIKYPFWQFTHRNKDATFASLNIENGGVPSEIKDRAIEIEGDIAKILNDLVVC